MLLIAKIDKRIEPVNHFDPDIATATTVATVRATIFNKLLASEANTASAARAGANIDLCKIKKFHIVSLTPAIGRLN